MGILVLLGISIQTYIPFVAYYVEQSFVKRGGSWLLFGILVIIAAIMTVLYQKLYRMSGFKTSIKVSVVLLMAGYILLIGIHGNVGVSVGILLVLTGSMTGIYVLNAILSENISEEQENHFLFMRMMGQNFIPAVAGSVFAITAELWKDRCAVSIWIAGWIAALILCVGLYFLFSMMRAGHYELWSEAGERVKNGEESCWDTYPRPQMKREKYMLLNGKWKLDQQDIRIPFPPQSLLSGYKGKIGNHLIYETTFCIPQEFIGERMLLHFGAVDQIAQVWVNNQYVGKHEGGYLPFSFEITDKIKSDQENRLCVKVTDTLNKDYPYGKQTKKRGGMWYTPVSGIWQTVWMEAVPQKYVEHMILKPDLKGVDITLEGDLDSFEVSVELENGKTIFEKFTGKTGRIDLASVVLEDGTKYSPQLWTTETPFLYHMTITTDMDRVETYFALRTISIEQMNGIGRVCLNGKPIFFHGVLDQGYYSDGLYLAANEREYERDILRMKDLGYNLLRKHIKVEPECFYYACDRLGMLVMQDMVNNGPYSYVFDTVIPTFGMKKKDDTRGKTNNKRKTLFIEHTRQTIAHLYNHPSIVAYTIFNEGWGQFHSDKMYEMVKKLDDTRLVDATSGWFAQNENDFDSEHIYFRVEEPQVKDRPMFVSECGGYSMIAQGHYYSKYAQYGYGACPDSQALSQEIRNMYDGMIIPGIKKGICGCIYTQVSDVEDEINGLYSYDRKMCKVQKDVMLKIAGDIQKEIHSIS